VIESVSPSAVAFRVVNTKLYLTNILYGDELRQTLASTLAAIPQLLADMIPSIVDYAIGRPTDDTNFEGPGYHYSPMTLREAGGGPRGGPNKLQMFELERVPGGLGIKSVLGGTYWRSQHWNHTVSQAPDCLRDETWNFYRIVDQDEKDVNDPAGEEDDEYHAEDY
jgi:hypothetical protein